MTRKPYTAIAFILDLAAVIILIALFLRVVLWVPPLDAAEYECLSDELQYQEPTWPADLWKNISITTPKGIEIVKYLEMRKGPVRLRYWSRVRDENGEIRVIVTPLTVGE